MLVVDGFVLRTFPPRGWSIALAFSVLLTGCHAVDDLFCGGGGCEWTEEEWTRVQSLAAFCDPTGTDPGKPCDPNADVSDPVYAVTPPADRSNAVQFNEGAVELGWRMYFDTRFSGNATLVDSIGRAVPYARAASGQPTGLMCASCHDPRRAGSDFTSAPNTVSIGAGWYDVNGQQTVNAAFYDLLYWNGRSDSLWSQAAAVSESGVSMNGDRLNTFWMIVSDAKYAELYNSAFPDTPLPTLTKTRAEVSAMLVTAADVTADPTLVAGECKRAAGVCPDGCVENSGACWPMFPLHGRPGRRSGCETRTPAKPAEPFGDAYDCVAGHTEERPSLELPHLERVRLLEKLGVRASFLGVGVDRVDYTKGIPERFRAIERFLEKYPAYRREFAFVQIGSPSRTHIRRYQDLMEEVLQEAERINHRFQTSDWKPIVFLNRQHSHQEILPYYRTADFCLVTSLHDGMNLVAKEFVASREDLHGVLILSRFAGASHELSDALIVNPYDTEQMADSIRQALEMRPEERRMRMQRMRSTVREHNVYRWAGKLIEELCEVRPASIAVAPYLVRTAMRRSAS